MLESLLSVLQGPWPTGFDFFAFKPWASDHLTSHQGWIYPLQWMLRWVRIIQSFRLSRARHSEMAGTWVKVVFLLWTSTFPWCLKCTGSPTAALTPQRQSGSLHGWGRKMRQRPSDSCLETSFSLHWLNAWTSKIGALICLVEITH